MERRRREAHAEALRAAARLAFSAAVLSGCNPTPPVARAPVGTQPQPTSPPEALPLPSAQPAAEEPPPSQDQEDPSCEALLAKLSDGEAMRHLDKKKPPQGLVPCCEEHVLQQGYDPNCCTLLFQQGAITATTQSGNDRQSRVLRSCSPWGPPMPPAIAAGPMRGRRQARRTLSLRREARRHVPRLPSLSGMRAAAIATWKARMVNEHESSRVFEGLARRLAEAGLAEHVELESFAAEERRHGALCGAVVEALGGEARARVPAPPNYPTHRDAASPLEAALRDVLSVCCMSETVAVALIGAERLDMPPGELRELLTGIYADEVGHARFGWRLLEKVAPRLDAATKAALSRYAVVALADLEEHELAHLPADADPAPEGRAYGLCNGRDARALFYDTVEKVIVPGLERHGISPGRAHDRPS